MLRISSIVVGTFLILSGIIVFGFFVNSLMKGTYDYDLIKTMLVVIIIGLLFFSGIYICINIEIFKNFLLLITSIFIALTLFEIILSTGYFDNLDSNSPIWIPYRYKLRNEMINKRHHLKSAKNKYGFNDSNRKFERRSDNVLRIAVLGDSFVWGTGVVDSLIWSKRLQKKFNENKLNVEILDWGKDGWSTKDERDFLYRTGYKFDIDMIIVAIVANDIDNGMFKLRKMIHPQGGIYKLLQKTILRVFPNAVSFIIDYINVFSNEYLGYGYSNWLKLNYTKENLLNWEQTIRNIILLGKKNNVEIFFVLLPENHGDLLKKYLSVLDSRLKKLEANYVNLFPEIKKTLKNYSIRQLWANPANGHPGEEVTKVYADYIFKYLLKNYKSLFFN